MASRPLLTPACFYLRKGDLIKPQEKKKSKTRSRCASESTAWTINSFVSGRGCPNCWHATPAMMDFFVSACHVGNLIWTLFWWLCPRPWLWAGLIQVSLQSSPLAFEQPAYPEKVPGESSLNIIAWWATCLWWCHLELGQSPIALSLTWPLPKTGTTICSFLINNVVPRFPDQPCCGLVN